MKIECEVTRLIHKNNDFQLVACIPIGEYENLAIHPRFHTITIKDPTNRLVLNKTYTFDWLIIAGCAWGCLSVLLKAI